MRIEQARVHQVRVNHRGDWLFVELHDDAGLAGWGEASHSGDDTRTRALLEPALAQLLAGVHEEQALLASLAQRLPEDKLGRTAASAVEQAVVDLCCARAGQSVADRLAGKSGLTPTTVPVYANVNRMCRDRTPSTVAAAGRSALDAGIQRLKFAPFDEVTPERLVQQGADPTRLLEPGADRLRALRDAVGAKTSLMVDCHWRFLPQTLEHLARIAREVDVGWIEDPLPALDARSANMLRDASAARIAGGEALLTHPEFERFARARTVDVLIADVKYVGGINALDRIAKLAHEHGLTFAPHNPSGPIATAASAHVLAANPNAEVLEFAFGEVQWRAAFAVGERLVDGRLHVKGPGLGMDLNLSAVPPSPQ